MYNTKDSNWLKLFLISIGIAITLWATLMFVFTNNPIHLKKGDVFWTEGIYDVRKMIVIDENENGVYIVDPSWGEESYNKPIFKRFSSIQDDESFKLIGTFNFKTKVISPL